MPPELNILLAEDSPDDAFFFKRALARADVGAHLHIVTDGAKAIDYLTGKGENIPDIVFLDLKMPNLNGFEVLEWMKQNSVFGRTKVVVLTSSVEPKEREQAEQMGAAAYFIKPIKPEQLQEVLKAAPKANS